MEGLLSFLIFAGLFYLMMRVGCGAHMIHGGHGEHGGHQTHNDTPAAYKDPVCGMEVDTYSGYGKMHEGQLYRFCSKKCLDEFDADPARYIAAGNKGTGGDA